MIPGFVSRILAILIGTLYPAYRSYKALKRKDLKEYMKWMMYWTVYALFAFFESISDMFISWLPFYYEFKILFLIYLLCPWTMGASILYRKLVYPWFVRHEDEIERFLEHAKRKTYKRAYNFGTKGLLLAKDIVTTAAVSGQTRIWNQLTRSYSADILIETQQQRDRPAPLGIVEDQVVAVGLIRMGLEEEDEEDEYFDDTPTIDNASQFEFNAAFVSPTGTNSQQPPPPDDVSIETQELQRPDAVTETPLKAPEEEEQEDDQMEAGDSQGVQMDIVKNISTKISPIPVNKRGRPRKVQVEEQHDIDWDQLPLKRDRKRHNKPAELDDSAYESNSIGSASTSVIPQPPPSRRRKPKATEPPRRKRAHEPQQRVPRKRPNMDNHVEF
uniref:Receptor expression-enhancing protein n=1 Tax=Acrobeloides nanus TaxID=290746 RepID=A0A914EQ50_9BILA